MKIAVAQISCSLGDPEANLLKVRDFSRRAKDEAGAELIVFPEMTDTGYSMPVIREHASDWANGFVPGVQEIAKRISIAIVSGVSERDGSSIYNSQVFVDSQGNIAAKYRKTHLYAVAPVEEQTCFAPGNTLRELCARRSAFWLQHLLRSSVSRDCTENWRSSRRSTLLSSLLPGLSRATNIFEYLPWHARSKTRATSLHRTASVKTMTCGFVAAPRSSIPAESSSPPHQQTAKN